MIKFDKEKLGNIIGRGATANVYAYDADKIIKIFNRNHSLKRVEEEYNANLNIEKTKLRVPKNFGVTQVLETGEESIEGCYAYFQERISNISVMEKVMENPSIDICAPLITQMINYQVEMHRIEATNLNLRKQRESLKHQISLAPTLNDIEKNKVIDLLNTLPDDNKICHMDYHMNNLMIAKDELICIDWADCVSGNPMADLARSLLIFMCDGIPDSIPKEVIETTIRMRKTCLDFYISTYEKLAGKLTNLDKWLVVVAAARLHCEIDDNKVSMMKVIRTII